MKHFPLLTATGLVLFLAQPAPTTQASLPAMSRSANQGVDQHAKLMDEVRKSPRKSTVGEALREFYPDGKATLSDHSDNQVVFISTSLVKGESRAISKPYGSPGHDCPNTYTLIKSVSNGKGHPFMQQFQVMTLP
jgi:hypothetical protein